LTPVLYACGEEKITGDEGPLTSFILCTWFSHVQLWKLIKHHQKTNKRLFGQVFVNATLHL